MQSKELNIGSAGEHFVIADLLLRQIPSCLTMQGSTYDVIADYNNKLIRIQVKTTQKMRKIKQRANPIYFFHIKRAGKNGNRVYSDDDFDCYALVAIDRKQIFYISPKQVKKNSVCIRDKDIDYSGNHGGGRPSKLYLQDLTWENYVKNYLKMVGTKAKKIN